MNTLDAKAMADTKQAYHKPQLTEFGSLVELTQSINGTGMSDGGGNTNNGMNRTH